MKIFNNINRNDKNKRVAALITLVIGGLSIILIVFAIIKIYKKNDLN